MKDNKKVSSIQAWGLTGVAILDLIALVLLSSSSSSGGLVVIFAGCEAFLIICAVASWKKYFEKLIDEKTRQNG